MYINPREAIEKGWIEGTIAEEQIQPNGIDVTLGDVLQVSSHSTAYVLKSGRRILDRFSILPTKEGSMVTLVTGGYYELLSNEVIHIPHNIVVSVFLRSTLIRSGLINDNGFYDSGFTNKIGTHVYQVASVLTLERGIAFAQVVFEPADSAKIYNGVYTVKGFKHEDKQCGEDNANV